ncbi:unnamed protein product [Didymodactylos carnosus]|uniref:Uncharacterized protein n=1 Tax=Didymodactylos carnosus TaxID=1234261 RepID=A0A815Z2N8_9BILA|nr:unnamed protein product [Didymodactylos carnosus]CAF1577862.1 unnamed protein product [Didymodactylos carnosus]CAF4190489.1 unnamed protein product [Didymodactylos carnosus]CAF4443990.1 unnamed protein product [Didymodactylos carnosus]
MMFMQQQRNDHYSHQQFCYQSHADYANQGRSNHLQQPADLSIRVQAVKMSTPAFTHSCGPAMDHDLRNHPGVANNLPCFIIQYDSNISPRDLPFSVIASASIHEYFMQCGVSINPFTVAVSSGTHELKLGVNNKEGYCSLIFTDKQLTSVNKKRITVVKFKFVPDYFTLIIRYVPTTFNVTQVKEEMKPSI